MAGVQSSGCGETGSVSLQLLLKCTDTLSETLRDISLPKLPSTTEELKSAIETSCNVPACLQDLSFESHPLASTHDVKLARIRSGDTITVRYLAEGDCQEILEIIGWLGLIMATLKLENPSITRGISESLYELLTSGIEFKYMENLAFDYFYPWLDARKYANKIFFLTNGGLDIMMELYSLLDRERWEKRLLKMKYLEYGILRVLWNLSETFALRRAIVHLGGLDLCMRSLMREAVVKGEVIIDRHSPRDAFKDWILVETLGAALGTLCNLSELPEVHMAIATQPPILYQLICISHSPSVQIMSSILVATVYLCLAATPETHNHIASVGVFGLMESCARESTVKGSSETEMDTVLLRYFTMMFIAQLALVSPHCIPEMRRHFINRYMLEQFFETVTYEEVRDAEIKNWYVWQKFMPTVKLAYVPNAVTLPPPTDEVRRMQLLSLRLVIFSLQNMLGRTKHRQVLLEEGLLDYVVCMPWFVPPSRPLKRQAQDLVSMLANFPDVDMQPPSLLSIARACLAKAHFGLESATTLSAGEIAAKLLPEAQNEAR